MSQTAVAKLVTGTGRSTSDGEPQPSLLLPQAPNWFTETFNPIHPRSVVALALRARIGDIIQELSSELIPRGTITTELMDAATPLKKVEILFEYLDAHETNTNLINAFQNAVQRRGGIEYLLNSNLESGVGSPLKSESRTSDFTSADEKSWYSETFNPIHPRSVVALALRPRIGDIIQELFSELIPRDTIAAELRDAATPLKKVEILFHYLDANARNLNLIKAFQHAVQSRGGIEYLLNSNLESGVGSPLKSEGKTSDFTSAEGWEGRPGPITTTLLDSDVGGKGTSMKVGVGGSEEVLGAGISAYARVAEAEVTSVGPNNVEGLGGGMVSDAADLRPRETAPTVSAQAVLLPDVSAWDEHLPDGGTLVSVYTPSRAAAAQSAIVELLNKSFPELPRDSGPFAYQLSPTEEAFVLFALPSDRVSAAMHIVAASTGLPVILRPPTENPLAQTGLKRMERLRGGASESRSTSGLRAIVRKATDLVQGPADADTKMSQTTDTSAIQKKQHLACIEIELQDGTDDLPVDPIRLYMLFEFKHVDNKNEPRDCVAATGVEVEIDHKAYFLDQSYSNVGFVVHRPNSIGKCTIFVPAEYLESPFTVKRTREQNRGNTVNASVAIGMPPSANLGLQHGSGSREAEERNNQNPNGQCDVKETVGLGWSKHASNSPFPSKDFRSRDLTWRPLRNQSGTPYNAKFGFELGLDLKRKKKRHSGIQNDISCVMRNQVMLWVVTGALSVDDKKKAWDPREPPKVRGIMLVTSTYIPNVFTDDVLDIDESIGFNIQGESDGITRLNDPEQPPTADNYIAVGRLPEAKPSPKGLAKMLNKLNMKKPTVETRELPFYEVVLPSDAVAKQLSGPLWPSMSEQLQKLDPNSARNTFGRRRTTVPLAWKRATANVQNINTEMDETPEAGATTTSPSQTAESIGDSNTTETKITTPPSSTVTVAKKAA
ncbi:hypothetical protein C8F01DRAFT_1126466 [Mycena amicta]|nr:hypothetical protein C8F01DRAFT_1126466 [Mycena amicta]